MRRSWARLGLMTVAAAGVGALAVAVLVEREDDAAPPRVHVGSPVASERPSEAALVAPVTTQRHGAVALQPRVRPAPRSVGEVLRQDAALTPAELTAWIADERLAAQVRYAALRRLEAEAPEAAVTAALDALDDVQSVVRLNAIAVLTRSADARAAAALERLDGRSRRLAERLARR